MNEVEDYILNQVQSKKDILLYFHNIFIERYRLKPKITYKIPMYYGKKCIVYLNADNRAGVDLAFIEGYQLKKDFGILERKNRKMVKSIEFNSIEKIYEEKVLRLLEEAISIDQLKK